MEGSTEPARNGAGRAAGGATDDPISRAQVLFTHLIEGPEPGRNGTSPGPPAPGVGGGPGSPPSAPGELHELVRATMATTDRIAEVVEVVGSQVAGTAADLGELGRVVHEALEATNERLAALEHALLDQGAPDAAAAEKAAQAMGRLRLTLQRVVKSGVRQARS